MVRTSMRFTETPFHEKIGKSDVCRTKSASTNAIHQKILR